MIIFLGSENLMTVTDWLRLTSIIKNELTDWCGVFVYIYNHNMKYLIQVSYSISLLSLQMDTDILCSLLSTIFFLLWMSPCFSHHMTLHHLIYLQARRFNKVSNLNHCHYYFTFHRLCHVLSGWLVFALCQAQPDSSPNCCCIYCCFFWCFLFFSFMHCEVTCCWCLQSILHTGKEWVLD